MLNDPTNSTDPFGLTDCPQTASCPTLLLDGTPLEGAGLSAASRFSILDIPVTVQSWGWIPITEDTTGFTGAGANWPYGSVLNLAYFGLTSTTVGSGFDLFNVLSATEFQLLPSHPPTVPPNNGTTAAGTKQTIGTPKTSSQCSIYLQSGSTSGQVLNFLCRQFPDNPWSQRMRGCLQALYDPKSGYLPVPILLPTTPASFFDVNSVIPGTGAHAVCALDASGIH